MLFLSIHLTGVTFSTNSKTIYTLVHKVIIHETNKNPVAQIFTDEQTKKLSKAYSLYMYYLHESVVWSNFKPNFS